MAIQTSPFTIGQHVFVTDIEEYGLIRKVSRDKTGQQLFTILLDQPDAADDGIVVCREDKLQSK